MHFNVILINIKMKRSKLGKKKTRILNPSVHQIGQTLPFSFFFVWSIVCWSTVELKVHKVEQINSIPPHVHITLVPAATKPATPPSINAVEVSPFWTQGRGCVLGSSWSSQLRVNGVGIVRVGVDQAFSGAMCKAKGFR